MSAIYGSRYGACAVEEQYRALLRAWPVPSEQLRVPTCQGETFVVACGPREAPPVVLLHGSGTNAAMWMGDVASWARHLRLYAVDMIGEPGLSAPSRPDLASDAYARWLDDVLAGLSVTRTSIVGISLGGWLALDYAIRRPERVERLALLCPGGVGRQKWGVLVAVAFLLPFGRWGLRKALRLVLGTSLEAAAETPEARAFVDHMMLIQRHFRPRRDKLPVFDDHALARLSMPMLVIVGGRDALLDSHDTRRRLNRSAPHATVRLLPGTGHFLPLQTGPILDFLRPH
jgi:pimeloyl-ACP methyl ester carboxylesterase